MSRFRLSRTGSSNLFTIAIAVGAIASFGGIAFACEQGGGGGGCGDGHGDHQGRNCPPDLAIIWHSPTSTNPSASPVRCTLGLTTSTLTVAVNRLAPGESCAFSAFLENTGEKAATLNEAVSISHPATCPYFRYSDNLPTSPPTTLAAGHSFPYKATISLAAVAGNACQGALATIHVTITGTASSCDDARVLNAGPVTAIPLWDCD